MNRPKTGVLTVEAIKTKTFRRGENLAAFIVASIGPDRVREKMVLAVTSKIMSLAENRLVPQSAVSNKVDLIKQESDIYLGEVAHGCSLTIKEGLFIPSAGIDESNSEDGDYILYPKDPWLSAKLLGEALCQTWNLQELGILVTDSHTTPLRRGVTGITLSYWGFHAIKDLIGSEDLFGRKLKMTTMNLADGMASAAVMMMGEGNESQPLAILEGINLQFERETDRHYFSMPVAEDLYAPFFLKHFSGK